MNESVGDVFSPTFNGQWVEKTMALFRMRSNLLLTESPLGEIAAAL